MNLRRRGFVDRDVMVVTGTEDAALRMLYEQHAAPLLSYALRLTGGDRGRSEDIVQETLLRAWRHPQALDPERGPVRSWLFTVARNVAVDAHRARRSRPTEVGDEPLALIPAADEIEKALDSWLVADAMSALSSDHRAVLVETYYLGRSVAEAAAVLGIPAGTVKSRTFYALRALKLALEERGVTSGPPRSMSRWAPTSSARSTPASAPRSNITSANAVVAATKSPSSHRCPD
jgi:RNA polymerase sigma-70 factor, ECF subfamily